jgi:hypothetical protein
VDGENGSQECVGNEVGRSVDLEAKPAEPPGLLVVQEVDAGLPRLRRFERSRVGVPEMHRTRVQRDDYGVTRSVPDFVRPAARAEIDAEVEVATLRAVTGKLALRAPAGIVTLEGTVATVVLLLESVTTVPAALAGPFKVTVPSDVPGPTTEVGAKVSASGAGLADTVRVADRVDPPPAAVMDEVVVAVTTPVEIGKPTVVEPAGTITVAGTAAAPALLLPSVTTNPPPAAAALRVTVPPERTPPGTLAGARVRLETLRRWMARAAVRVVPPKAAEIVTVRLEVTCAVVTGNDPVVAPAGIVRLAGTIAEELSLPSAITAPPAGAPPPSVTVPVETPPPETVVGARTRVERPGGVMVTVAVRVAAPRVAVTLTAVLVATAEVVAVNVAVVAPAATVTLSGTAAAMPLLERRTRLPGAGAGPVKVTVPVDAPPPGTFEGAMASDAKETAVTARVADRELVPTVAVSVTLRSVETGVVVAANVPPEAPRETVTEAGTETVEGSLLDSATTVPGATPLRVKVPWEAAPPATEAGLRDKPVTARGWRESEATTLAPGLDAVTVSEVAVETVAVETVKGAEVAPAGTTTEAGTPAIKTLLDASWQVKPVAPAAVLSVTVPWTFWPPITKAGLKVTPTSAAAAGLAVTLSAALFAPPGSAAVTVTLVAFATEEVVTGNVAMVPPAATVTLEGTDATVTSLLASATAQPPAGAGVPSVIVPRTGSPPPTVVGASTSVSGAEEAPKTWISARPMLRPTAWSMVKRIHETVRGEKSTKSALASLGRVPTATLLPSLKRSVPARTWSVALGRS